MLVVYWHRSSSLIFGKTKQNISLHINNIFKEGELDKASVVKESLITAADGKQYKTKRYNLDVTISVGYRVKSQRGTQFRIWATQRLREYLVQGYSINQDRFDQNAAELQQALALIRKAARSPEINAESGRGLVEIVTRYTQTFLWLQRYDEGLLNEPSGHTGGRIPNADEAMQALQELKQSLMARLANCLLIYTVTDLLQFSVIWDKVFLVSPLIQRLKARPLLYFVVKNHPFLDGNKRPVRRFLAP